VKQGLALQLLKPHPQVFGRSFQFRLPVGPRENAGRQWSIYHRDAIGFHKSIVIEKTVGQCPAAGPDFS